MKQWPKQLNASCIHVSDGAENLWVLTARESAELCHSAMLQWRHDPACRVTNICTSPFAVVDETTSQSQSDTWVETNTWVQTDGKAQVIATTSNPRKYQQDQLTPRSHRMPANALSLIQRRGVYTGAQQLRPS